MTQIASAPAAPHSRAAILARAGRKHAAATATRHGERAAPARAQRQAEQRAARRAEARIREQLAAVQVERLAVDVNGYTEGVIPVPDPWSMKAWVAQPLLDERGFRRVFRRSHVHAGRLRALATDFEAGDAIKFWAPISFHPGGAVRRRRARCGVVLSVTDTEMLVTWVHSSMVAAEKARRWAPYLARHPWEEEADA